MKFNNLKNTDVSSSDFEVIPKGTYDLMIVKAEEKIAKSSGNPYISVGFRILNDDAEKSYRGRYVWANINGSEVGVKILKSILVYNESPLAELEGDAEIDPSSLVGMKVSGRVGVEKDQNDDLRNKVGFFKPVSEEFAGVDETYFEERSSGSKSTTLSKPSTKQDDLPF